MTARQYPFIINTIFASELVSDSSFGLKQRTHFDLESSMPGCPQHLQFHNTVAIFVVAFEIEFLFLLLVDVSVLF